MHLEPLVLVAILFIVNANTSNDLLDYYQKLITLEVERSSNYQFPKDANEYRPSNTEPKEYGTYDFVVIGSGSAGSVIAARLSEIPSWNVLLLEAGEEENDFTDIPGMSQYVHTSKYNWGFNSTQQEGCCLSRNGFCPFPRGRSLGGTTTINALVYARGNRDDYDRWAALGNPGWSYQDVLPYFIKSENAKIDGDAGYHGFGGNLNVEYHNPTSRKVDVFLEANREMRHSILDYNGRNQVGVGRGQFTTNGGRRGSSARSFLNPARNRSNLHVLTRSYVTKILISKTTKTAYGVLFSHQNVQYVVRISKEVILSAGVVGSPQILMISGIGPKSHLEQYDIPVVQDLQVGRKMHDHLTFHSMFFLTPQPEPSVSFRESIAQYLNGTGPFTIATNPQAMAFYGLNSSNSGVPDIEVVMIPMVNIGPIDVHAPGHVHPRYTSSWGKAALENHVFQLVLVLLHPKTRGSVYLASKDPYEYPLIDSKCLADADGEDIENVYKGIEKIMSLTKTKAFKKLKSILLPLPHCLGHQYLSKEYWYCLIRSTAINAYHAGGTCAMGPNPNDGAVVDNHLKVHGVNNLRIADASVVPVTISGHMSAPVMMVGEKAADIIKKYWFF